MHPLLIAFLSGVAFVAAYHTYGRWLGRRIFRLAAGNVVPSHAFSDGRDFVPTKKSIVFGHHFTSIAGTGPIVGPAIAIMYGWVPALLWVILGSIFIGAVHDFGALVVSLRNGGRSVGDIAGDVINKRTRLLFLCVLFLCLLIVIAIFGLVIAAVLKQFPQAIFPCLVQIPAAVATGLWLHRRGNSLVLPAILALVVMYATTFFGDVGLLHDFNQALAAWPNWLWIVLLLGYGFVASVLPVWTLLQPRDYINSLQLLSALALIVVGLVVASVIGGAPPVEGAERVTLEMVAPVVNLDPPGAPPIWPFLFITIACGAVSGFHCLVSSGTSSKQLNSEPEARFVGYGAMLTEGFLAVLVILACGAGLGLGTTSTLQFEMAGNGDRGTFAIANGTIVEVAEPTQPWVEGVRFGDGVFAFGNSFLKRQGDSSLQMVVREDDASTARIGGNAFRQQYQSWQAADGLAAKVGAFVTGAGNFVAAAGVPRAWAAALMAVLVASFALTTLDTAVRLQRYVIQEGVATLRPYPRPPASGRAGDDAVPETGTAGEGVTPAAIGQRPEASATAGVAATGVAVVTAALLAAVPASGEWTLANVGSGGMILWPLFGATNQLLAGLAFAVILFYLRRRRIATWFLVPPMLFMLVMPAWATMVQLPEWLRGERYVLAGIAALCLALEVWMVVEAALLYGRVKGRLETEDQRGFAVLAPKEAPSVDVRE